MRNIPHLVIAGGVAAVYFAAGRLGLSYALVHSSITPVWAPTGIAIAAMLLFGVRVWPGVALGAFLTNTVPSGPIPEAIGITAGNTLESLLGVYLIQRFAGGVHVFEKPKTIFRFMVLAGGLCTLASALIGVSSLCIGNEADWKDFFPLVTNWWLGDATGAIVLTPFLILWAAPRKNLWSETQQIEFPLFALATLVTSILVFGGASSFPPGTYPLGILTVLPLMWSSFRFDRRITVSASLFLALVALWGTLRGYGPFSLWGKDAFFLLQGYAAVTTILGLTVSALVLESRQAHAEITRSHENLEQRVEERTDELTRSNAVLRHEIQERRRTEENLRKSEERYRAVAETANEAIIISDIHGNIISFNPAAENVFGYLEAEIVGKPITMLMPERFRAAHREGIERLQATGETTLVGRTIELAGQNKDGKEFPIELSLAAWKAGEDIFFTGILRDITQRRIAEERIRESEGKFRHLLNSAPDAIVIVNAADQIVLVNAQVERIFGYQRDELLGKRAAILIPERFHPKEPVQQESIFGNTRERSVREGIELFGRRKNGSEFPIDINVSPLETENGLLVSAAIRDITRRKTAEESAHRLAAIVESTDLAVMSIDFDGRITSWNHGAEMLYGYKAEEAIGRQHAFLLPPGRNDDVTAHLEQARSGKSFQLTTQRIRKNGKIIEVIVSLSPTRDSRGRIIGLNKITRDITELRQAEEEKKNAEVLRNQVDELARRTMELSQLNEMGEILRSSQSLSEAYPILPRFLRELFPADSGTLYVFRSSRNLLEAVASWGEQPPREDVLHPNDCWSLRRGTVHRIENLEDGTVCKHLKPPMRGISLCVPMIARGEVLGVLNLLVAHARDGHGGDSADQRTEYKERLAKAVSQQVALALLNVQLQETLRSQAIRDPLTGLFNRRYLEDCFAREIHRSARKKNKLGVLMIDLDHFKKFNDRFGHAAGDEVLKQLSAFLQKHSRAEDILCRFGGEEFLLLLTECSPKDALRRAEQIRTEIKTQAWQYQGRGLGQVTLSMGLSFFPDHAKTPQELVLSADESLYRAKSQGRDRIVVTASSRMIVDSQEKGSAEKTEAS